MRLLIFLMLFIVIFSSLVSAATIKGDVYDLSLNKVSDVVVNIDSTPKQSFVVKDGSYSFTLIKGTYTLSVKSEEGSVEEIIEINEEGIFNLDLILFPDEEEMDELDLDVEEIDEGVNVLLIIVIIVLILLVIGLLYLRFKPKKVKKEEIIEGESDLDKLINFIKSEGGRTTQKAIRRKFGLSEAKISLMITELEHKNKVKRIKKGRGNIIILEKR